VRFSPQRISFSSFQKLFRLNGNREKRGHEKRKMGSGLRSLRFSRLEASFIASHINLLTFNEQGCDATLLR
jgi:hypothetical protein